MSFRVDEGPDGIGLLCASSSRSRLRDERDEAVFEEVVDWREPVDVKEAPEDEADTARDDGCFAGRAGGSMSPSFSLLRARSEEDRTRGRSSRSRDRRSLSRCGCSARSGAFPASFAGVSRPRSARNDATRAEGADGR